MLLIRIGNTVFDGVDIGLQIVFTGLELLCCKTGQAIVAVVQRVLRMGELAMGSSVAYRVLGIHPFQEFEMLARLLIKSAFMDLGDFARGKSSQAR